MAARPAGRPRRTSGRGRAGTVPRRFRRGCEAGERRTERNGWERNGRAVSALATGVSRIATAHRNAIGTFGRLHGEIAPIFLTADSAACHCFVPSNRLSPFCTRALYELH